MFTPTPAASGLVPYRSVKQQHGCSAVLLDIERRARRQMTTARCPFGTITGMVSTGRTVELV
jgi:hypothetical protein